MSRHFPFIQQMTNCSKGKPHFHNRPIAGALFVLGASFIFAVLGALVKTASASLPNEIVVFFRNVYALLFILPCLLYQSPQGGIKTKALRFHLIRGLAGVGSMYCFFYTLGQLRLAEAVLFSFTAPLFIPLVAYLWLQEPVSQRVGGAVILGFIGVLLILKPGTEVFQPASLVGLTAGILVSISMVTIRRMSVSEPPTRIVFYFSLLAMPISGVPLFWSSWQWPQGETWAVLIFIGMFAVIGQLLVTKGYSIAASAQVGPFSYGIVIFSTFIGWIFWDETLDVLTWMGAVFICVAGIVATRG